MEDEQILSWSQDNTLRLWDGDTGQQPGVWDIDEAAFEVPDLWRAYKRQVFPDSLTDEAGAHTLSRGLACVFPELKTRVPWQGDGSWVPQHLLPGGNIVATCDKHLEIFSLYHGNHRVTLAEAKKILQQSSPTNKTQH